MAGVREVYNKLKGLRDNLSTIAEKSVIDVKSDIVESQKSQLEHGSNANGESFRKYRNKAYAAKKYAMNSLPGYGNPDLKYTGAFYSGIYARVEGGKIVVGSTDPKAQWLEPSYNKVFGLNPQEMEDFLYGKLKPVYHNNILEFLKR